MKNERKKKIARFAFILNGFLFLMGGVGLLLESKWIFGSLQILAALVNFAMLINWSKDQLKKNLAIGVLLMNFIVAISVAMDYFQKGTDYIQYVWIFTAILSLVVVFVQVNKNRSSNLD